MPIYEYLCENCGSRFERLRRFQDAENNLAEGCPSCGQQHVARQHSTFAAKTAGAAPEANFGGCPAGMCGNPGFCGRN